MKALSAKAPRLQSVPPLPTMHLELWVTQRKHRAQHNRLIRKSYEVARRVTASGGGNGPWLFLIDADPAKPKTARLRTTLRLKPEEDLWLELVFYPDGASMRKIIRQIWKEPGFTMQASALDPLISRRRTGYQATLAYATLATV